MTNHEVASIFDGSHLTFDPFFNAKWSGNGEKPLPLVLSVWNMKTNVLGYLSCKIFHV